MPAMYAHDRFGQDMIARVGGTIKELIEIERTAFDIGLQGPDLLFYYRPLFPNDIQKIGTRIHNMLGKQFFARCARVQREQPGDASLAYLLGSVCHYALDCRLHPLVDERCEAGDVVHTEVEMSFDRSLMVEDGLDPLTVPIGGNLEANDLSDVVEEIVPFYPPLRAEQIEKAIRSMVLYQKLLLAPNERRRAFLSCALYVTGPHRRSLKGHIMSREPVEALRETDAKLRAEYDEALAAAPAMLEEFLLSVYQKKTFGMSFAKNYNGEEAT